MNLARNDIRKKGVSESLTKYREMGEMVPENLLIGFWGKPSNLPLLKKRGLTPPRAGRRDTHIDVALSCIALDF